MKLRFSLPKERRTRDLLKTTGIIEFDCTLLRQTVQECYVNDKKIPSLNKLLHVLKEKNWF